MSIFSEPIIYFTVRVFPSMVFCTGMLQRSSSDTPAVVNMTEMMLINMVLLIFQCNSQARANIAIIIAKILYFCADIRRIFDWNMDYQKILEDIYKEIQPFAGEGKQADYIPALAKVNPDQYGIALKTISGESYKYQKADTRFSIQSISKVFALAMGLSLKGEDLWKIVGKEPSGTAFNSLVQLEMEKGVPRNPFMNAGAMVLTDIVLTSFENPKEDFHLLQETKRRSTQDSFSRLSPL